MFVICRAQALYYLAKLKKQSFAVFIGVVINNHGEDGFEKDDSSQFKR